MAEFAILHNKKCNEEMAEIDYKTIANCLVFKAELQIPLSGVGGQESSAQSLTTATLDRLQQPFIFYI